MSLQDQRRVSTVLSDTALTLTDHQFVGQVAACGLIA